MAKKIKNYQRLTHYNENTRKAVVYDYISMSPEWSPIVNRLAAFEDAIERGEILLKEEAEKLKAENAALREQISKMIMPPCTLGDTLYITSFYFGDGYDEAGNAVHTSGWQITETKVDEKNFYRMCDLVRNKKAFFSRLAAEAHLAELKGEKE